MRSWMQTAASGAEKGMHRGTWWVIVSRDKLSEWTDGRKILYHQDIIKKISLMMELLQKPLNVIPAKAGIQVFKAFRMDTR